MTLRVLDLFSGIGGFSLGLERTGGFETVAFCEIEPFPCRVLAKHWPGVPCYDDVRTLTADRLAADGIAVDVITGGFPCQDISVAGRRAGLDSSTRSGLWSEIVRLIGEIRPAYVIVENVANLLSGPSEQPGRWFSRVLGDLAELGYDAEWENIPASAVGAPHRRERVWIVAHPHQAGCQAQRAGSVRAREGRQVVLPGAEGHPDCAKVFDNGPSCRGRSEVSEQQGLQVTTGGVRGALADPDCHYAQRLEPSVTDPQERPGPLTGPTGPLLAELRRLWVAEPDVGRVAHGVPARVDRLAALGNAVVPAIPELIGRAILAREARP